MKEQMRIENLKRKAQTILKNNIQKTLDSIPNQIAILDNSATIVVVNRAWKIFADQNDLCSPNYCIGENYIEICKKASTERQNVINQSQSNDSEKININDQITETYESTIDYKIAATEQCQNITEECKERLGWDLSINSIIEKTEGAEESLKGIENIFAGEIETFSIDYPCHSPDEKRWFRMKLIRFDFEDNLWILVSHENITQSKLAEINLLKSENKLKGIIQSVPDAMCMIDRDQNVVWANDVAKKLYGSSLVGQKCYRAYGRWNNICQNCIVHKTFRDGKVHSGEYSHLDVEGNERVILCTSSVAGCDEFGNISNVMEIMRDITEKKQSERFLKFMQLAVDTTADGVYWIKPDGSIRYVNQYVLRYTGYTEEEITKLKVHNIDPNVSEESWNDTWNQLRRIKIMRFETVHRTKNGIDIPFEVTANHIIFDKNEEYNFAVVRNISERKQAEREIRRLSQAVEYSPVSVVITDVNGNIEYVNRKFTQVTGYSRKEAVGQNPRILNAGHRAKSYFTNLWNTILNGKEWKGEFVNKKKNGEIYWEAASISPVLDENGKILYFVAMKEDITARKKIMEELKAAKQKAEAATQAKSDFLATMSHEIRTPMNAIMGMSHLMMDTKLNDIQYGYLSNIQSAADSLLTIINDILDLSKIEAGKMEFEAVEFEWNQIIEKIFNVLKFTANEKKLELIYSFGKDIPQFMIGDPTRVSQVLMNLISNAVKYTPQGEVAVHTELMGEDENTITLNVTIKDTGIGISESKISSLFTPFTQADSSTTRKYGGTGLGLVIAKRIVNKMGGDIEVQSVLGKGSTFSFNITLTKNDKSDLLNNNNLDVVNTKSENAKLLNIIDINALSGLSVMVVEPHINARRSFVNSLKSLNMRVMATSNSDEAIQLMELTYDTTIPKRRVSNNAVNNKGYGKIGFDLVFINANLGANSINCPDTIRTLESIIFELNGNNISNHIVSKTKYIVIHDFTLSQEAREIAEQVTVHGFLPKPITPSMLIKTIVNVLNTGEEVSLINGNRVNYLSSENIQEKFRAKNLSVDKKNILVVDDDEINRQIVVAMVKKIGLKNIVVATNGEQALKIAQEQPLDLILMDVEMPIMDGLEATRKIRELGIKTQIVDGTAVDIPIIALTGHALDEYREKCFKAGMNAHIDKPIQPEKLFSALQKWLYSKAGIN
ncbi:MAG: PAS domain S-box protein [Desulfamplus sp.]|nr:PAS domain S-box protein [Desulfamplus sp.]